MTTAEIFAKDQVLTLAKAKELIGKNVICTSPEYKGNSCTINEFVISGFISSWDESKNRNYPQVDTSKYTQYDNFQEYWMSYMSENQIKREKNLIFVLDENGKSVYGCHTKGIEFKEPTFTGSDADREVYFVEI